MDQQRTNQGPDGSYDLKDSHGFVYKALSKELYVGNVYLRVYTDQPDFEISEPEAFCVALIDFISFLLHNQCTTESGVQTNLSIDSSSPETSELPNDAVDSSVNEQHVSDDSLAVSDGKTTDKEDTQLIKNLQFGLISLKVHYSFVHLSS